MSNSRVDWGLQPLNVVERHDLLELLDRRYQRSSTGFASQLPVNQWHHAIPDQSAAVAAVDRLVHLATIFEMNVESYRRRSALSSARKRRTRVAKKQPIS